ncbi:MAG: mechanosensitive ion channel [Planctomycetaceae bacterium]|nr:mechanosensitive ion channel [Planctomycetaceae bacterium]
MSLFFREIIRKQIQHSLLMLVFIISSLGASDSLLAQSAPESVGEKTEAVEKQTPADVLSQVDELVSQINSDPESNDAAKTRSEELKKLIQESLEVWRQEWELAGQLRQEIKTIPTETQKMSAEIERLRKEPSQPWNSAKPVNELEQELEALKVKQQSLQDESTTLAQLVDQQTMRRQELQQRLDKLVAEETSVVNTLQANQDKANLTSLEKLQRLYNQTLRVKINQQRKTLEAELQRLDARQAVNWNQIKTELIELQLVKTQEQVKVFTEEFQKARQREAARAVKEAEAQNQEVIRSVPELKILVDQYQQWARENQDLAPLLTQVENDLIQHQTNLSELKQQYERVTALVDQVGHTGPIGTMLRKFRSELADIDDNLENLSKRSETLANVQLKIFELEGEQSQQFQPDLFVQTYMPNATDQEQEVALKAIGKQREMLKTLRHNYVQYNRTLYELNKTDKNYVLKNREFASYINERVLWIRSSPSGMLTISQLKEDDEAFQWVYSLNGWKKVWTQSAKQIRQAPLQSVALILLWSILLILGTRWRRDLNAISKQVAPSAFYKFYPTVKATILTLLIAIVWPLFFWGWAWLLGEQADREEISSALIPALQQLQTSNQDPTLNLIPTLLQVGYWFFTLEFMRLLFRSRGLADSHFQWNFASMLTVRRNMRWLMLVSVPLLVLCGLLQGDAIDPQPELDAWERVAYILFWLTLTVFLFNIFHPASGLFQTVIDYKQNAWMDRLRWPICLILASIPLVLAMLSFLGYHYTALQLSGYLSMTAWFLIVLFLVRALLHRWIMLGYRRLSILRSQQKREQKEAERLAQEQAEGTSTGESPIKIEEDRPIDLRFSSHQIRRLLNATLWTVALSGLWLIWADLIPAFSMLDGSERFAVWDTTKQVTDPETGNTVEVIEQITIFDLILGLAIAVLTVAATRNIPGLLEMTVLEQLPIDASVRYAITTIARYICILIGVIIGFQVIGLAWSQVQWMATALTFGLAFGLQEIFANFISGIILLFERPIRVGDIVTIDNVSGVVSRIRMRATTITDWDRKEYVVPNKEFITGRLLNWTLSDPVNRIVINVGIAYGSNVEQAREIILRLATDHPETMEDPPPVVTFDGFGDSTLNLTLRTYLPNLENRLLTIHQLHLQINNEFNAAGIEIAFPQRDLHIRSMPADFVKQAASNGTVPEKNDHQGNGHSQTEPPTEPPEALTSKTTTSNPSIDPGLDE